MMRLAAIDIGTNSLHMIVVRVRPDLSFEVDRPREGNGAPGRRGPRRPRPYARSDAGRPPGAVQVPAARRVAQGRRDGRGGDERRPRGGERRRVPADRPAADRHPAAGHLGHGGSAAHPHGRRVRRRHGRRGRASSSTSAAAASKSRGAPGPAIDQRPELQARRHPADRALRQERSDLAARRAQARAPHRSRARRVPGRAVEPPASIGSSARRARFSASARSPRRTAARAGAPRCATAASRPSSCTACASR